MDFHSLTRRELQSLCKLNKIPANITNVAMADALQALEIVKGIEEFMNVSKPETADLVESVEKVEASSPKAPTTRCKTSTRHKVKINEPENLPAAAARSTRRGNRQSAGEVEESKNEILKTPAVSMTRRKAPGTLSCRNVNTQLNECENEAKEEGKLQTRYSTRRSTRLTEKKSTEPRVKKESEKAVKIDSFDEVNMQSEEVNVIPENTVISGNPDAEVEEICNVFKKLDVVMVNQEAKYISGEEKQDFGELKQELTNKTSNLCEDERVVEEGDVNSVLEEVVDGAKDDCGEIEISKKESANETSNTTSSLCEDEMAGEEGDVNSVLEEILDEAEDDCGDKKESTNENPCEDEMAGEEGDVNSVLEEILDEAEDDCGDKKESTNENPCEDEMAVEEGDVNSTLEELVDEAKEDCEIVISNPCEHGELEEKLEIGEIDDQECGEKAESADVNSVLEEILDEGKEDCGENPCEDEMAVEEGDVNSIIEESRSEASNPCEHGELEEKLKMGEKDDEECDVKPESDGTSSPFELQNLEQILDIEAAILENKSIAVDDDNLVAVEEENSDSNSISIQFEDENLEHKIDLEEQTLDASEAEKSSAVINQENHSDFLPDNASLESGAEDLLDSTELPHKDENLEHKIDLEEQTLDASEAEKSSAVLNQENHSDFLPDNASLESGAEDLLDSTELPHKDENLEHFDSSEWNNLCAVKEQIQVPETNGSSIDMAIDNIERPIVMEEESENTVGIIPGVDLKPEKHFIETTHNEKAGEVTNVSEERGEFHVFPDAPCFFKKATPFKNMSIVSDDKENIDSGIKLQIGFVDQEGKNIKKEEKAEIAKLTNLNEMSLRKLKKQLKLLSLNEMNKEGAATRPALQVLSENKLVGGETKN